MMSQSYSSSVNYDTQTRTHLRIYCTPIMTRGYTNSYFHPVKMSLLEKSNLEQDFRPHRPSPHRQVENTS